MCTVVFENKNFKAENAVLDKFGGQAKNQSVKVSYLILTCKFFIPMNLPEINL